MKRGIIVFSKDELNELIKHFNMDACDNAQLKVKLKAAYETIQDENSILISDDELEIILDDIGIVDENNTLLKSVTEKISKTLIALRGSN